VMGIGCILFFVDYILFFWYSHSSNPVILIKWTGWDWIPGISTGTVIFEANRLMICYKLYCFFFWISDSDMSETQHIKS